MTYSNLTILRLKKREKVQGALGVVTALVSMYLFSVLGVEGKPTSGVIGGQFGLDFLAEEESGIACFVAHFDVIPQGQLEDGIAGRLSQFRIALHGFCPILGRFHAVEQFAQYRAILHAAVHALTVKWDNGVGSIAHQADGIAVVPRITLGHDQ